MTSDSAPGPYRMAGAGSFDSFSPLADAEASEARPAGLFSALDPRWIVRAVTVLRMKSRPRKQPMFWAVMNLLR